MNIAAETMDANLYNLIGGTVKGRVHSVFKKVANLLFDDDVLISLLVNSMYMVPFGVRVKRILPFEGVLYPGDFVLRSEDGLLVGRGVKIRISWNTSVALWDSSLPVYFVDEKLISNRLGLVLSFLKEHGKGDLFGILLGAEIPGRYEGAFGLLERFVNSIEEGRDGSVYVKEMLGFGRGLTPSFDDWIAGFSSTYYVFCGKVPWLDGIKGVLFERTTTISAYMLLNMSKGLVLETYKNFWRTFVDDERMFHDSMVEVVGVGATSGSDWLTGVAVALKTFIKGGIGSVS